MARITLTDIWETYLTHEEVIKRILTFFNEFKIKIKKNTPTEILGKQGSHFRARSGFGLNPALYPKKIYIYFTENGGSIQIEVRLEDVYYLVTPAIKNEYRKYMGFLMNNLKKKLPERPSRVCVSCGTQLTRGDQVYCIECGKKLNPI